MKKISILLVIIMIFTLCGCVKKKVFKENGISITLTEQFQKVEQPSVDWCYESSGIGVTGTYETYDDLEKAGLEITTLSDYIITLAQEKSVKQDQIVEKEDYSYFDVTRGVNGVRYKYRTCVFQANDGYWIISFVCYKASFNAHIDEIEKYAKSVVIEQ